MVDMIDETFFTQTREIIAGNVHYTYCVILYEYNYVFSHFVLVRI